MLSNPPFGVEWKKVEYIIKREYETQGYDGRFGAGLPRINDGSLLFLQHMLSKQSKLEPTRIIIVFNGSPLFTGDAGSGESNIRRWIIEKDWLEGIVALPDQLFYNTGISTYLWVLSNRKSKKRKGQIQLVNATGKDFYQKMRKSLGNKRNEIQSRSIKKLQRFIMTFLEVSIAAFSIMKILATVGFELNVRCGGILVLRRNGWSGCQNSQDLRVLAESKKKQSQISRQTSLPEKRCRQTLLGR
jgi:type I restriction-modification system DNA methylase subunit